MRWLSEKKDSPTKIKGDVKAPDINDHLALIVCYVVSGCYKTFLRRTLFLTVHYYLEVW